MEIIPDKVPDDLLLKITNSANKQIQIEKELEDMEAALSAKELELAQIAGGWDGHEQHLIEGIIPTYLAEAGVEELVLTGGMRVKIKEELKPPSMAAESPFREPVLNWADKSGNGGVIKDVITIPFDKGDLRIKALMLFLETSKLAFERFRTINWQTLKALFNEIRRVAPKPREDFESDEEFEKWKLANTLPMAELNIQLYKKSKIDFPKLKEPKGKK